MQVMEIIKMTPKSEHIIKVVDLFSGAGGLTYGFVNKVQNTKIISRGSFNFLFANEYDKDAANTFNRNFPQIEMINADIRKVDLLKLKKMKIDLNNVDLIIGGPPCQSYSTIGSRRDDDRAKMYKEYNRLVKMIDPKMFIFENVLGMQSFIDKNGNKVIDIIESEFREIGYRIEKQVLDAVEFGVPQYRKRIFIVGIRSDIKTQFEFPNPILLHDQEEYITVSGAVSDFVELDNEEFSSTYKTNPHSPYQNLMRGNNCELTHHFKPKNGDRIMRIIKALEQGESKIDINRKVSEGILSKDLLLTSGFSNTYGRLWWDRPSVTLTNSFTSPSSMRCIHPLYDRPITTREGARIQSFPDSFDFCGSAGSVNQQIGNAVPPILASCIADSIEVFFNKMRSEKDE